MTLILLILNDCLEAFKCLIFNTGVRRIVEKRIGNYDNRNRSENIYNF
ncbi:hypothetical protein LEP1GSC024_2401 [Leptospira noguchii str. 2001034031]|uniref:Uncharacterized protein n=1 Tax=Leptospira noguchii str. 2001034031 TaxID=1193053 RepID=M6YSN0_9LEPT|nr:hypothetical protein LEP1GSC024_2401 [Leptospira noguchii str. 2001034031]